MSAGSLHTEHQLFLPPAQPALVFGCAPYPLVIGTPEPLPDLHRALFSGLGTRESKSTGAAVFVRCRASRAVLRPALRSSPPARTHDTPCSSWRAEPAVPFVLILMNRSTHRGFSARTFTRVPPNVKLSCAAEHNQPERVVAETWPFHPAFQASASAPC